MGTGLGRAGMGGEFIACHLARARGGCGLTILEAASVHSPSRTHLSIRGDSASEGHKRLSDAIRPTGMKLFQQLWHGGNLYPGYGEMPLTVSNIAGHFGIVGRPAAIGEIEGLVEAYAAATQRARSAELDASSSMRRTPISRPNSSRRSTMTGATATAAASKTGCVSSSIR